MSKKTQHSSWYLPIITAMCLTTWWLFPVFAVFHHFDYAMLPLAYKILVGLWDFGLPTLFIVMWRYYSHRNDYWNGLLWISACMNTGWSSSFVVMIFPALFAAYFISAGIMIYNVFFGSREKARLRFKVLIDFFYRNRMRQ